MIRIFSVIAVTIVLFDLPSAAPAEELPGTISTFAGVGFPDPMRDFNGNGRIDEGESYRFTDYGDGGPATNAGLGMVVDLAVDTSGVLFIASWSEHRIRRVGPDGLIAAFAGLLGPSVDPVTGGHAGSSTSETGPATETSIYNPEGIAIGADGFVYISDGSRIRRVGVDGRLTTYRSFLRPSEIAMDGFGGIYYVTGREHLS